jgi:hypothetical protein
MVDDGVPEVRGDAMKIVHEINNPATTMAFADGPYARDRDDRSPVLDFPVAIEIHAQIPFGLGTEVVIMEGSARCLRDAFIKAIQQIDTLAMVQIREDRLDEGWSEVEIGHPVNRQTERSRTPKT